MWKRLELSFNLFMVTNYFYRPKFGNIDITYFAIWYEQMERALNLKLNQPEIDFWLCCLLVIRRCPSGNIEFSGKIDMGNFSRKKKKTALARNLQVGVCAKGYQNVQ